MKIKEIKSNKHIWIDIEKPSRNKLLELKKEYNFHSLDIEDVLTYTQRPKIEKYKEYYFLILRFPVYNKKSKEFSISEVDLFVGKKYFISIHRGDVEPIVKFIKACATNPEIKKENCQSSGVILYNILKNLFLYCFPIIDHINDDIDIIEKNIFKNMEKEMVEDILRVKRNIITLRRIIGPHRKLMDILEQNGTNLLRPKMDIYFSDVTDYVERIWDILDNQRETIISLENTNETLISHRSSEIVKTLTIFSAILLPLTLIASIYGMNTKDTPFIDHPNSFWIIMSGMVITVLAFLIYFMRKKWL